MTTALIFGLITGWLICWFSDQVPKLNNKALSPSLSLERQNHRFVLVISVMLITAVLFAYLWHLLVFNSNFFFLAGLCTFLILIAVIDLKYQLILNVLILPAIGLMLLYQFWPVTQSSWLALFGGIAAFSLFMLVGLLSPDGLGGGDIKLAAFLGVTFGLPYVFWALLAGVLLGGVTAVVLLISQCKQRKTHIPYGPFLCFGAIVALLFNPLPWLVSLFA